MTLTIPGRTPAEQAAVDARLEHALGRHEQPVPCTQCGHHLYWDATDQARDTAAICNPDHCPGWWTGFHAPGALPPAPPEMPEPPALPGALLVCPLTLDWWPADDDLPCPHGVDHCIPAIYVAQQHDKNAWGAGYNQALKDVRAKLARTVSAAQEQTEGDHA